MQYSPLDQIHAGNVGEPEIVWRWTSPNFRAHEDWNLRATLQIARGVLYATGWAQRDAEPLRQLFRQASESLFRE